MTLAGHPPDWHESSTWAIRHRRIKALVYNETMKNDVLAAALVSRLNRLISEDSTGEMTAVLTSLFESKVQISEAMMAHPTLQCAKNEEGNWVLGPLGLLNGLLGTIQEGKYAGWGYITAVYDDHGKITHFGLTGSLRAKPNV